jgi:hypothetical protein
MMIGWTQRPGSVPFLFRLTLITTTKQREPTINEIPAQRHSCRYHHQDQKFELYSCSALWLIIELHRTA